MSNKGYGRHRTTPGLCPVPSAICNYTLCEDELYYTHKLSSDIPVYRSKAASFEVKHQNTLTDRMIGWRWVPVTHQIWVYSGMETANKHMNIRPTTTIHMDVLWCGVVYPTTVSGIWPLWAYVWLSTTASYKYSSFLIYYVVFISKIVKIWLQN